MHRIVALLLTLAVPGILVAQNSPAVWIGARSILPDSDGRPMVTYGLTRNDWKVFRETYPQSASVAVRVVAETVRRGPRQAAAAVVGCSPGLPALCGIATEKGRFLQAKEFQSRQNVCVVNRTLADLVRVGVGDHLKIADGYYTVVGICKAPRVQLISVKEALPGSDASRKGTPAVYLPLTTMWSRMGDVQVKRESGSFQARSFQLSEIWISGASGDLMRRVLDLQREEARGDYRVGEKINVVPK